MGKERAASSAGEAIGARIARAIEGRSSQVEIAKATETSAANVSRYLAGTRPMPVEWLVAVVRLLNLNGHWVLTGEGPMAAGEIDWSRIPYEDLQDQAARQRLAFERNVGELIARLREMEGATEGGGTVRVTGGPEVLRRAGLLREPASPEPREAARAASLQIVDPEELPEHWIGQYVPIIGRLAAGHGVDTAEAEAYPAGVAASYLRIEQAPPHGVAVRIEGDSMTPEYRHGDLVVVDLASPCRSGVCCVITRTNGDRIARVKRLVIRGEVAQLHSTNPAHRTIRVPASEIEAYTIWSHLPAGG